MLDDRRRDPGRRAAGRVPGALSAAADLAARSGARLAWVPRRAGERGALEAGACPTCCPAAVRSPTPPHGSTSQLPGASTRCPAGPAATPTRSSPRRPPASLGGLVVGGVDPTTCPTRPPPAPRSTRPVRRQPRGPRQSAVTEPADVVLPVAPVTEKAGTFVNWEGRPGRSRRCFATPAHARPPGARRHRRRDWRRARLPRPSRRSAPRCAELGPWDGDRAVLRASVAEPRARRPVGRDCRARDLAA